MKKQSSLKLTRVCFAATLFLTLAACNTLSGAGRDVSSVGNAVSSGANNAWHR